MEDGIKMNISRELIRIAKQISALDQKNDKAEKWDVYEVDVSETEGDGWDVNSLDKVFSVNVPKGVSNGEWEEIVEREFDKYYKDFGGLSKKAIYYDRSVDGEVTIVLKENYTPLWTVVRT